MRELNCDLTLDIACRAHTIIAFPLVAFKRRSSAEYISSWGVQGA